MEETMIDKAVEALTETVTELTAQMAGSLPNQEDQPKQKKETVASLKEQLTLMKAKHEAEVLKLKNRINIDLDNLDDRKTLRQLMKEGKVLIADNNKSFIIATALPANVNADFPPTTKVVIDEIEAIQIWSYFQDMDLMADSARKCLRQSIIIQHRGYSVFAYIDEEQLAYLTENGLVPKDKISYWWYDMHSGLTFFSNKKAAPSAKEVLKTVAKIKEEAARPPIREIEIIRDDTDTEETSLSLEEKAVS